MAYYHYTNSFSIIKNKIIYITKETELLYHDGLTGMERSVLVVLDLDGPEDGRESVEPEEGRRRRRRLLALRLLGQGLLQTRQLHAAQLRERLGDLGRGQIAQDDDGALEQLDGGLVRHQRWAVAI